MSNFVQRCKSWYKEQTPTVKGFLWMGLVLIVGIALRWSYIWKSIGNGFNYFSN